MPEIYLFIYAYMLVLCIFAFSITMCEIMIAHVACLQYTSNYLYRREREEIVKLVEIPTRGQGLQQGQSTEPRGRVYTTLPNRRRCKQSILLRMGTQPLRNI